MSERMFRCCKRKSSFSVIYSVAGEQKHYQVCSDCIHLECFSKYIIEKIPIRAQHKKIFENEIPDENVETEIINEKLCETVEQGENLSEQIEEERSQFCSKNKRGAKL